MSPHEVDQLLDRRLDVCFGHGDQNGDGVLESADALALAARIVAATGTSPSATASPSAWVEFSQVLRELLQHPEFTLTGAPTRYFENGRHICLDRLPVRFA
ncbi:hypothetical protein ACFYUJ_22500 [Streptomyces sp. NPDC004520]|uniref:hypothetical protein n=1 Tax=Streptomyces sp. NPDC004520 TaxID=3364702 RepID=UPI003698C492